MQVVKAVLLCILGFLFLTQTLVCHAYIKKQQKCSSRSCRYEKKSDTPISDFVGGIIIDAASLLRNLFSVSSAKILTGFTPLYILTRMHDERIQKHFYDECHHHNINQFPRHCHNIAHYGVGVPMVALSSLAIFAHDEDLRLTARMFAIGLPFVQSGKDIIKKLRFKACLRPWHENYSRHQRSSGGFPSGHMANVVYMATLFGMRHGPAWGIPLGLFASFVFADFLNCNRHYLSQLVAGAGLGVIFAVAASKVVDKKLAERYSFSCGVDSQGVPCAQFCYRF
jgi:membrane-associated phospholipid phosphatase